MQVSIINEKLSVTLGRKDSGMSVEAFVRERLLLPNGFVKKLLSTGCVRIQGRIVQGCEILKSGQKLWIEDSAFASDSVAYDFKYTSASKQGTSPILFEDKHILIVNKPANLIVHAPKAEQGDTLDNRVASYFSDTNQEHKILHIHRLDKGTTGTVIYGKHGFVARALDEELRLRTIKRTYIAVTFGKSIKKSGEISTSIGRDRHQSGKFRVSATGKDALTKYRRIAQITTKEGTYSLVACRLETGRTHQIRVHLGSIGAPIVGDILYGGTLTSPFNCLENGIGLHACSVHFFHPYEETDLDVHAPLPHTFKQLFAQLGFYSLRVDEVASLSASF